MVVLPLVGQVWVVLPAVVFLLPPLGLRLAYQVAPCLQMTMQLSYRKCIT